MQPRFPHVQASATALFIYLCLSTGGIGLGQELSAGRLAIAIPVSIAAIVAASSQLRNISWPFFLLIPLVMFILIQAYRAHETSYALQKIDGFLVAGLMSLVLVRYALNTHGIRVLNHYIVVSALVVIAAIVYKAVFGFWDRGVRFFINGPIVFAWLCSIALLISAYMYQRNGSKLYPLASFLFFVAILWAASKGPLLALAPALALMMIQSRHFIKSIVGVATCGMLIFIAYALELLPDRLLAIERMLLNETTSSDYGSITYREIIWQDALDVFWQHRIFGAGMSNWPHYSASLELSDTVTYPHNWTLEILAEHGLVGMTVFIAATSYAFLKASQLGRVILVYFLFCLSVSGDLSYWRFLIFLPLALDRNTMRRAEHV